MLNKNKERPKCSTIKDEDFNRAFANHFKNIRLYNKMTQSSLAEKLNVSTQTISAYENAVCLPSIKCLVHIANVFDTSVDNLLSFYKIPK